MIDFELKGDIKFFGAKKTIMLGYNTLLRKIDFVLKKPKVFSKPFNVQVEITTKCNLRCKFCISPVWDRRGKDMGFSDFKRIIDQFPYLTDVLLQGQGEPLLTKDLFKMVEYCKKKRIRVTTTTNGTLLSGEISEKIIHSGIDYILISLEGTNQAIFDEYRPGVDYNKLIENIKTLVKIRGDYSKPKIMISFVATKGKIHELPKVVDLAADLGVDYLEAEGVLFLGDERVKKNIIEDVLQNSNNEIELIQESYRIAERKNLDFRWKGSKGLDIFSDTYNSLEYHIEPLKCRHVFRSGYITFDGHFNYCVDLPDPSKYSMGNLLEEDFGNIWNNSKYLELRKTFLESDSNLLNQCAVCKCPKG